MRNKSEPIEFAHTSNRIFVAGLNKHLEKGLDQKTYPGLDMWRQENGDVYWEYQGKCGYLAASLFESLVCKNSPEVLARKEKVTK